MGDEEKVSETAASEFVSVEGFNLTKRCRVS